MRASLYQRWKEKDNNIFEGTVKLKDCYRERCKYWGNGRGTADCQFRAPKNTMSRKLDKWLMYQGIKTPDAIKCKIEFRKMREKGVSMLRPNFIWEI